MHHFIRYLVIVVLAAVLFIPFLGHVHLFDWDEINFAECAREMILSKDYLRAQIDFKPFWEKPPLFIWMQVLSMKAFGVNEFAARFPNAFMGVVTLATLYSVGKKVISEKMAIWWVLLYAATWLPHFYFKSGIIDPTFNFFIFVSFYQVHLLRFSPNKITHALLAGLFMGLAVLTKGPVAILVAVLAFGVFMIVNRGLWGYKLGHLGLVALGVIVTCLLWFGIVILYHGWDFGSWFLNEFITYQIRLFRTEDADHGGPFLYHFIILLLGCFPASIFLFQFSRKRVTENEASKSFTRWMWIMFWVVLLLFSIVKTKIVHYSSLCYFPLTYLAALQLSRLSSEPMRMKKVVRVLLLTIGTILGFAIAMLPVVGLNKEKLIPLIDDPFAVGNLQANVSWSYAECAWGILYIIGIWIAVIMMRKDFRRGMITLCITQIVIIQITVLHFTPKIEAYSQRAAIDFFKSFEGKDVYVQVLGYKSYAHLFYTQKNKPQNQNYYNEQWLLHGKVDKPTYFVCKVIAADQYRVMPDLQLIGEQNGFVFFKRR